MKDLLQPENDAEAAIIRKILEQENIPVQVRSFHDTAYDGLFQSQKGWGVIRVPEEYLARARQLIEEWKKSAPADLPWNT